MEVRQITGGELAFSRLLIVNAVVLFTLIIFGGLALSVSGFLPDNVDQLISEEVYPRYSTLGVIFLANSVVLGFFNSAAYGRVKDAVLEKLGVAAVETTGDKNEGS